MSKKQGAYPTPVNGQITDSVTRKGVKGLSKKERDAIAKSLPKQSDTALRGAMVQIARLMSDLESDWAKFKEAWDLYQAELSRRNKG